MFRQQMPCVSNIFHKMEPEGNKQLLNWLTSIEWWRKSLSIVGSVSKRLILPAVLMSVSNICSAVSDFYMRGGIDLGFQGTQAEINKLLMLCLSLLISLFFGLILGLAGLSLWLLQLTALARSLYLPDAGNIHTCAKHLKGETKYLSTVWIISLLYLIVPILPMSVLVAFGIIANMNLNVMGEPLLPIPQEILFFMNLNAGLLALIALDFSLLVTVLSSATNLLPKQVNSKAKEVLNKHFGRIWILNIAIIVLNVCISAPFAVFPYIPQLAFLPKSLEFTIGSQIWFAMSSVITWPLTLLLFVEFLRRVLPVETVPQPAQSAEQRMEEQ